MNTHQNELGQPIGASVPDWRPNDWPKSEIKDGRYCQVVPLDIDAHAEDLFESYAQDIEGRNWTYLPYGPFVQLDYFIAWMRSSCTKDDPFFHAIIDKATGKAVGVASFLRITPDAGSIEVGHIHFSPLLQRKPLASEAMFLMMRHVFDDLNYRRYEWKCDSRNAPSCKAARRFGFTPEGVFRQAAIVKGRNRDTAWFSIIDSEWPAIKLAYETWLSVDNFDENGVQKQKLSDLMPS